MRVLHEACHEYGRDPNLPLLYHLELPHHRNWQIEDVEVQRHVESALDDGPRLLAGTSSSHGQATEGFA